MSDVEKLRSVLNLQSAKMIDDNLQETVKFFHEILIHDPLSYLKELRGVDWHRPVRIVNLSSLTKLSRHRFVTQKDHQSKGGGVSRVRRPFVYFTKPGVSPFQTGTSFKISVYETFVLKSDITVLMSTASSICFGTGAFDYADSRNGGGVQYMVPLTVMDELVPVLRSGSRTADDRAMASLNRKFK